MITEAIVLAGGFGTRLRSVVPDLPKCMAPVAGKPFISYVISYFLEQGIDKFIFSLGYKHQQIIGFLQEAFPSLNFSTAIEEEPLGTGGAARKAAAVSINENVLLLNADTFFRIDLAQLNEFHNMHRADCTICLKPTQNSDRYGVVELGNDGSIISFMEKKWYGESLINGGIYALNAHRFLSEDLGQKFSFEKDYLERLYPERKMMGFVQRDYFIDIGIPADFEKAQYELPQHLY